jgi:hypothetical protein
MSKNTSIKSKEISMVHKLINETIMSGLLEKYCIDDCGAMKQVEAYECDNDHIGLIAEAKNKNTNDKEKLIIDALVGYPVAEQVFNVLYKKGSDCGKRIIVYTKGSADFYTYGGEDDDAIKNLVENLNRYGTNIFMVKMNYDSDEGRFKYMVTAKPPIILDYEPSKLPSEAKLKEEEFWGVYYWQQFEGSYYPWEAFTDYMHEPRKFGHVYGPDGAEMYVKWTEKGLFFEAIDENDEIEYLKPIWDNRKHELQMLFPDTETTFIFKPGKLPRLLVKIWSAPVQSLVNTTISEKKRLASEILEKFNNFVDFITSPLNDLKNEEVDELQEVEQLAETV